MSRVRSAESILSPLASHLSPLKAYGFLRILNIPDLLLVLDEGMIGLHQVIGLGAAGGGHHTPDAERTLVAELTAGHVVQLGTVGQEADVYALHVLLNIELRGSLSTGALQRGVELTQSVELHTRALTHDLWDAAAQCSQHADDGVLGEGASVTCDVLCQSSGREVYYPKKS